MNYNSIEEKCSEAEHQAIDEQNMNDKYHGKNFSVTIKKNHPYIIA